MAQPPRLDSILSFSNLPLDQPTNQEDHRQDAAPDSTSFEFEFEFAFAPPLHSGGGAGDLILPAYPVFDRRLLLDGGHALAVPAASASTAPPSPDTYCPWVPRSARDPAFPKSASTGEAHRWRLRDLVGAGGRSHSDGKEKFVFLQPAAAAPSKMSQAKKATTTAASYEKQSAKPQTQEQRQRQKQGSKKKKAATEMDMTTAHKLFYGQAGAGDRKQQKQASYLPYRPGIVGFFANVHALGRSHHHPY